MGIMDYNDNGPVPWETEQTSIEDLVYGHQEDYHNKEWIMIDLTDDQIDDLMEAPHQPEEEKWWYDTIFQIDPAKESEFLKLAKSQDIEIDLCISKKRGLYHVYCYDCFREFEDKKVVIKQSPLGKMLDRGMIKCIYRAKDFFIHDELEDDKLVFNRRFSSAPYYIYAQPYSPNFPAERMNIPANPVKLSQFPPALRDRVPRLPIKFSECPKLQIAEWVPCSTYVDDEMISVNGFVYQLTVLTDDSEAYVCTSQRDNNFFEYCPEKKNYNCKECTYACYAPYGNEFSYRPTVMFVCHPFSNPNYEMAIKSDAVIRHSIRIPLLPKIPYKHPKGYHIFQDEVMKDVTEDMLADYFQRSSKWFEDIVHRLNPRVIILEEKTFDLLSSLYAFDQRHITVSDREFPVYLSSEVEENREEITRLALLPYQGTEMPYMISKEEMKRYKKQFNVPD